VATQEVCVIDLFYLISVNMASHFGGDELSQFTKQKLVIKYFTIAIIISSVLSLQAGILVS